MVESILILFVISGSSIDIYNLHVVKSKPHLDTTSCFRIVDSFQSVTLTYGSGRIFDTYDCAGIAESYILRFLH